MSELKGQLLGIVMVIIVFGAVSTAIATLFYNSRDKIVENSATLTKDAEDVLALQSYNDVAQGD